MYFNQTEIIKRKLYRNCYEKHIKESNPISSKRDKICYNKGVSMTAIKLTTVGNSTGAVIPKDILEHMHVGKGDTLYLIEDENGYRLTPYNEDFINQIGVIKRY